MSRKRRILVCDDEPYIRTILNDYLEDQGYQVHTVPDGRECIKELFHHPHDVLLLDIAMPHVDGLQVIREIRGVENPIPVIAISGHADGSKLMDLGIKGFVQKPFNLDHVNRLITDCVQ